MLMDPAPTPGPVTPIYKTVSTSTSGSSEGARSGVPVRLDVYLPGSNLSDIAACANDRAGIPVLVYFLSGGLVNGNGKSRFPEWLRSGYYSQFYRIF